MVAAGFREEEIWEMPINRFTEYLKAVARRERLERAAFTADVVSAVAGALTGKKIQEYIDMLQKDDDGN